MTPLPPQGAQVQGEQEGGDCAQRRARPAGRQEPEAGGGPEDPAGRLPEALRGHQEDREHHGHRQVTLSLSLGAH